MADGASEELVEDEDEDIEVGDEYFTGTTACVGCGRETSTECELCGTPVCCGECAECEQHVGLCGALVDEDAVGISLNETEIKHIVVDVRQEVRMCQDGGMYIEYLLADPVKATTVDPNIDLTGIKTFIDRGIRVFIAPARSVFVPANVTKKGLFSSAKTAARKKYESARHLLRTLAEAFVFYDERMQLTWPAVVIFGHKPRSVAYGFNSEKYTSWPHAYYESLKYVNKSKTNETLCSAASRLLLRKQPAAHSEWVRRKDAGSKYYVKFPDCRLGRPAQGASERQQQRSQLPPPPALRDPIAQR